MYSNESQAANVPLFPKLKSELQLSSETNSHSLNLCDDLIFGAFVYTSKRRTNAQRNTRRLPKECVRSAVTDSTQVV